MSAPDEMNVEQQKLAARKQEIRLAANAARRAQSDKDGISRAIVNAAMQLPAYQMAACVMWYVDVRAEVRTRLALPSAIESGKRIVVPFCAGEELELFHLESMDELSEGMYNILEPRNDLRSVKSKRVRPKDLDLVLVPGVAFDRIGNRIGHGKGYYDKLLGSVRAETRLVALAFECQVFHEIPRQDHDMCMDLIVTQDQVHEGRGRRSSRLENQRR